jgi:hypothetical protein
MAKNTRKSSFWEQKSADASRTVAVAISECRGHLAWPWGAVYLLLLVLENIRFGAAGAWATSSN